MSSEEQAAKESSILTEVSDDGRFVAFDSYADNLVAADHNGNSDIFVRDLRAGLTERINLANDGAEGSYGSFDPAFSGNGQVVAFRSTDSFVAGWNLGHDIYLRDRVSAKTERVSQSSSGVAGNGFSYSPAVNRDGRYVAFGSGSNNLVPGDRNGCFDFFVHDRQTHVTERVSVSTAGEEGNASGNGGDADCAISGDGRYVAFQAYASNLVAGDTNGSGDIFVRDRQTGVTERVSLTDGEEQGNSESGNPALAGDGRLVVFQSYANNLVAGDTNLATDIFVRDRQTGETRRVSVSSKGEQAIGQSVNPALSDDGRFVAFTSFADNLVPDDDNGTGDVFVHDLVTGTTERVSVSAMGVQGNNFSGADGPASLSADGGRVAFGSYANNLVPGDTNDRPDIFAVGYTPGAVDHSPEAKAGPDKAAQVPHDGSAATTTAPVTLDGRGSTDPDGDPLTFQWRNAANSVLGTTAQLLVNLSAGAHVLTLRVTDSGGLFSEDQVTVSVQAEANGTPVANAGADKTASTSGGTAQVQLDGGSSVDPDGDPLTYKWTRGASTLANGVAPTVALSPGTHELTLTVTDPYGAAGTDQVVVTVQSVEPPGDFELDTHAVSSTEIKLTWKDPSKKEKHFEVQRSEDGGVTWKKQAKVKAAAGTGRSVSWSDRRVQAAVRGTGLRAAALEPRRYGYRVLAVIPRLEALVSRRRFCFVLAPPTDLRVEDWTQVAAGGDVPLAWQNRCIGDEGVEMEVGVPLNRTALQTTMNRVSGTGLERANTLALAANTYHEIRIRFYNVECGESSWTEPILFFTPPNVAARGTASVDRTTITYAGRRGNHVNASTPTPTITNTGLSILQVWTNLPQPYTPFLGPKTGYFLDRGRRTISPSLQLQPGASFNTGGSFIPDFIIESRAAPGNYPGTWVIYTSDPLHPVIVFNLQGTVVP